MEIWKPVPHYEGFYEVNSLGNVRRIIGWAKDGTASRPQIRPNLKRELNKGYLRVTLSRNDKQERFQVHCLVAAAFIGPTPSGHEVNHKSGVRTDCSLGNLEYATRSENNLHAYSALGKKSQQGSQHGRHKVTEAEVLEMRSLRAAGMKLADLSARYGIGVANLSEICSRKTWRHI